MFSSHTPPPPPDWSAISQQANAQYGLKDPSTLGALFNLAQYGSPTVACVSASGDWGADRAIARQFQTQNKPMERTMFQEVVNDVKVFVREHRGIIYFVACMLIIDYFVFQGLFKERLKSMASKIVGKIEQRLEEVK